MTGSAISTGDADPPARLNATISGTTLNGRTSYGETFTGTISAQGLSGTFMTAGDGFSGTFSGSTCSLGG
jgi:hypothetical protein